MTEEQHDWTVDIVKRYWQLGLVFITLGSFCFGVGVKISTMQSDITEHSDQIAAILQNDANMENTLNSINVTTIQNAQQLADLNRKIGSNQ